MGIRKSVGKNKKTKRAAGAAAVTRRETQRKAEHGRRREPK